MRNSDTTVFLSECTMVSYDLKAIVKYLVDQGMEKHSLSIL
jgi:hypothetical protein